MKKRNLLLVLFVVAVVGTTLVCRLWPRTLTPIQCSEVYRRYACSDGIRVSFIKNKHILDAVTIDVTMLEAENDSAWNAILHDFNISPLPTEILELTGDDYIEMWEAPKYDYTQPKDSLPLNNDLITLYWSEHKLMIFNIETMQQLQLIIHHQFKEIISKVKPKKNKHNEKKD